MPDHRFEQLKQKYVSALRVIEQVGIRLQNLHVQDDKLFIRGEAPSQQAKNAFWDQVKLVDPSYSDLIADITVSPAARQAAQAQAAQEQPESVSERESVQTYRVQKGDTLSKIAKQFYGDANQYMKIFEANRDQLDDPNKVQVGQELIIPED